MTRRGYTLVEMVAVMATMAILLTTIGTTIHMMVRATGRLRNANATLRSWERFNVRLRADAHRAARGQVADNKLTLEGATGTIVYQQEGEHITRRVNNGAGNGQREYFNLPRGYVAQWTYESDPQPMLRLTLVDAGEPDRARHAPPFATEILAAVGLEEAP